MGPYPRALVLALLVMAAVGQEYDEKTEAVMDWLRGVERTANERHRERKLQLLSGGLLSGSGLVQAGANLLGSASGVSVPSSLITAGQQLASGDTAGASATGASLLTNPSEGLAALGDLAQLAGGLSGGSSSSGSSGSSGSTTSTPPPTRAPTKPPGTCGDLMTISIQSFTEYRLYVEGKLLGYSPGVQFQTFTTQLNFSDPVGIAIESTRDMIMPNFDVVDGLYVNITVCGRTYASDFNWDCTDTRPWTNNWRLAGYDTSKWMQARLSRIVPPKNTYDTPAFWIWSKSCNTAKAPSTAYCKAVLNPKCKNTCGPAPQPDLSCYTNCNTDVPDGSTTCSLIAADIASKCPKCSKQNLADYTNYCKTSGCTPAQCNAQSDPAPVPDTSCAAACNSGISKIRETCDQQAYIFNSGCLGMCGPEAYYYLQNQCVNQLNCGEAACLASNTTVNAPPTDSTDTTTPRATVGPTPDLTCFAGCLSGMNKYTSYCDKIHYALTANCNRCSASVIEWAHASCEAYQDPDTNAYCTKDQCGNSSS